MRAQPEIINSMEARTPATERAAMKAGSSANSDLMVAINSTVVAMGMVKPDSPVFAMLVDVKTAIERSVVNINTLQEIAFKSERGKCA